MISAKAEQVFEDIATIRRLAAYGRDGDTDLLRGLTLELSDQGRDILFTNVGQAAIITWGQAFARTINVLEDYYRMKGSRFVHPGAKTTDDAAKAVSTVLGSISRRLNKLGAASGREQSESVASKDGVEQGKANA